MLQTFLKFKIKNLLLLGNFIFCHCFFLILFFFFTMIIVLY